MTEETGMSPVKKLFFVGLFILLGGMFALQVVLFFFTPEKPW